MKKVLVGGVFFVSALAVASSSFAGAYFAGNIGMVTAKDSELSAQELTDLNASLEATSDNGMGVSLAAGARVNEMLRAEGEFVYRQNDLSSISGVIDGVAGSAPIDGDIKSMALMANLFADFNTRSAFTPFVGAGIGYSKVEVELGFADLGTVSDDDMVLAYQLILGTGYKISDTATLDLSYRYFATADPDIGGVKFGYATHNIMAGVRVNF